MNALLVEVIATSGGAKIARQILPPGEYLVGRGEECALRFEAAAHSTQHARNAADSEIGRWTLDVGCWMFPFSRCP